jgi:hypothetical protein
MPESGGRSLQVIPRIDSRVVRILLAGLLLMLLGCRWHKAEYVILPEGFTGWAMIEYSVPRAPALAEMDGHFSVEIPTNGRISTSTPMRTGLANDRYYSRTSKGLRQLAIADFDNTTDGEVRALHYATFHKTGVAGERQYRTFFVGTLAAFKIAKSDEPRVDNP